MSAADYLVGVEEYELDFVEAVLDDSPVDAQTVYKETIGMSERAIAAVAAKRAGSGVAGTDDQTAAEVPFTPAGGIAATNVQTALVELDTEKATDAALTAHISDASAAHAATAVSADSTTLVGTGTDVQAVLEELDNGIADHLADTSAAHAASAVSADSTTLVGTGTDVQAVLEELDDAVATNVTNIAAAVPKSLYDANTILAATTDNTPAALTVGASTFVGRKAAGDISAMSATEAAALLTSLVPKSLYDANTVLAATSDDTPAAVTMGASTILARLAAGNIVAATVAEIATLLGPSLPGYVYAHVDQQTPLTVTATTEGAAQEIVTAGAVTYDGAPVLVEFWSPRVTVGTAATVNILFLNDAAVLGLATVTGPTGASIGVPVGVRRRFTPTAGSHTIRAMAYRGTADGTVGAGTGATTTFMPAFIRITKA